MPVLGTNGAVLFGGLLFLMTNLSFGAAIAFYDAFLPDIAAPKARDKVSSFDWVLGYPGRGILLVMISLLDDKTLTVQFSIASIGLWSLVFMYVFPSPTLMPAHHPSP